MQPSGECNLHMEEIFWKGDARVNVIMSILIGVKFGVNVINRRCSRDGLTHFVEAFFGRAQVLNILFPLRKLLEKSL